MRLENILDILGSLEKNSFIKIIDNIINDNPRNISKIESILNLSERNLKSADNLNIVEIFELIEEEFTNCVRKEFLNATSQFDILIDIITRDGNNIIKRDWFASLYKNEIIKYIKVASQLLTRMMKSLIKSQRLQTMNYPYFLF